MEILDPDLWDDDGKAKKPSEEYMQRLEEAQQAEGKDAYLSYARAKRELKVNTPASVGDVVHLWTGATCLAALVCEVDTFTHAATLRVFVPNAPEQWWHEDHDEDKKDVHTWHWPCGEGQ